MYFTVLFSIVAVVLVTSTSFFVVGNTSRLKKLNISLKDNDNKINTTSAMNNRQIKNLVDQVNRNDASLDRASSKLKKNIINVDNESKTRTANMNNRLTSFKNISSANFMGLNNRMKKEHDLLNERHQLLKEKQSKDIRQVNTDISNTNSRIGKQEDKFNIYSSNNDYIVKNIEDVNKYQTKKMDENYISLLDALGTNLVTSAENLDAESKKLVQQTREFTNLKYDHINQKVSQFIDIDVPEKYVHKEGKNLDEALNNRFFQNTELFNLKLTGLNTPVKDSMKNMVDMINLTEDNRSNAAYHKTMLNTHSDELTRLELSKLDKNQFKDTFEKTDYYTNINKNITDIKNLDTKIGNNLDNIDALKASIESIQGASFDKFNSLITANTKLIEDNFKTNQSKMDTNFATNRKSIDDGLKATNLVSKLKDQDLELDDLEVKGNLTIDNDLLLKSGNTSISIPTKFQELNSNVDKLTNKYDSTISYNPTGTYRFNVNNPTRFVGISKFEGDTILDGEVNIKGEAKFQKGINLTGEKLTVNEFDQIQEKNSGKKLGDYIDEKATRSTISRSALQNLINDNRDTALATNIDLQNVNLDISPNGINVKDNGSIKKFPTYISGYVDQRCFTKEESKRSDLKQAVFGTANFASAFDTTFDTSSKSKDLRQLITTNSDGIESLKNSINTLKSSKAVQSITVDPISRGDRDDAVHGKLNVITTDQQTNNVNVNIGTKDVIVKDNADGFNVLVTNHYEETKEFPITYPKKTDRADVINMLKDQQNNIDLSDLNVKVSSLDAKLIKTSTDIQAHNIVTTGNIAIGGDLTTTNVRASGYVEANNIKLGNKCLKMQGDYLQICDTDCSSSCKMVWDTQSAPNPARY